MARTYRVILPLAHPSIAWELTTLGAAVALHKKGEVVALNILPPVPREDGANKEEIEARIRDQNNLLQKACRHTRKMGLKIRPVTLTSQKVQETIINEARARHASLVLMEWNGPSHTPGAILGNIIDKVVNSSPSDVAVFTNRGLNEYRILLPTAGGPESHLGGQIAAALQNVMSAKVTLLHLVKGQEEMAQGKKILEDFENRFSLKAYKLIKTREDFTTGILEESKFYDLIILGGSQEGLFKKIFIKTIPEKVVRQAACSVLVTHMQGRLPLLTYLFGYRRI